jgi:hypothetical protein
MQLYSSFSACLVIVLLVAPIATVDSEIGDAGCPAKVHEDGVGIGEILLPNGVIVKHSLVPPVRFTFDGLKLPLVSLTETDQQ